MWNVMLFLGLGALIAPALTLPAVIDEIPILRPTEVPILRPDTINVTEDAIIEDLDTIVVDGAETTTTPESNESGSGSSGLKEFDPSDCFLAKSRGPCRAVIDSWFFNVVTKACEPFSWSGCQGNNNRFPDRAECEARCSKPEAGVVPSPDSKTSGGDSDAVSSSSSTTTRPVLTSKHRLPDCPKFDGCADKCVIIQDRSDRGCKKCLCGSEESKTSAALPGNITVSSGNNVTVVKEPQVSVGSVSGVSPETDETDLPIVGNPADNCQLPNRRGHCRAMLTRYHYDPQLKDCVVFHYGGCDGNPNNFVSREKCLEYCKGQ